MSTPNVINYTSTSGTLIHKICSAIKLGLVTGRAVTQSRHVINDVTGPADHLIIQLTVDDLHAKHTKNACSSFYTRFGYFRFYQR